jgi:hypothetical protein
MQSRVRYLKRLFTCRRPRNDSGDPGSPVKHRQSDPFRFARNGHSVSPDIDLVIVGRDLTLEALGCPASEFEESPLPVAVDLLRYDTIMSEPLREHID